MRPDINDWALEIAYVVAKRATCPRRQVGCVLLDKYNRIIGLGYNGVPRGEPHCEQEEECSNGCRAIHAEANALIHCTDAMNIETVVTTCFPCDGCAAMLKNTSMKKLVFAERSSMSAPSYTFGINVEAIQWEL